MRSNNSLVTNIVSVGFVVAVAVFLALTLSGREPTNHYERLGLFQTCSESDIRTAFRKTALRYHPDKNPGDEEAKKKFLALVEARDVLLDPDTRREYDAKLRHDKSSVAAGSQSAPQQSSVKLSFRLQSWECITTTCWWFTFIRDTFSQLLSPRGAIVLLFYLAVASLILEWFIPRVLRFCRYLVFGVILGCLCSGGRRDLVEGLKRADKERMLMAATRRARGRRSKTSR